jgi:hypothetical protein
VAEERTYVFKNFARSTLGAALTASATTLQVDANHGDRFPSPTDPDEVFSIVLTSGDQYEIVYCTARAGDYLTIERAKEGTTALAFAAGALVLHQVTAGFWEKVATRVVAPESESFEITTANGGNVYGFEQGIFGSSVPSPATFYNGARLVTREGIGETGSGGFEFWIVDELLPEHYTEVEIETDGGQVILQLADVDDGYIDPAESYYYWTTAVWNVGDIFSNPKTVTFR